MWPEFVQKVFKNLVSIYPPGDEVVLLFGLASWCDTLILDEYFVEYPSRKLISTIESALLCSVFEDCWFGCYIHLFMQFISTYQRSSTACCLNNPNPTTASAVIPPFVSTTRNGILDCWSTFDCYLLNWFHYSRAKEWKQFSQWDGFEDLKNVC